MALNQNGYVSAIGRVVPSELADEEVGQVTGVKERSDAQSVTLTPIEQTIRTSSSRPDISMVRTPSS